MKSRIGLYGGSFDPVHMGHIGPVLEAQRRLGLSRTVYLPTSDPPHKPGRVMVSAHRRFAMVEIALLEYPDLEVSAFELSPGQVSYTIDSAEHFSTEYPESELYLLIGSDSFRDFETWRRWRDLAALCRIAVLTRQGEQARHLRRDLAPALSSLLENGRALLVENEPVEVSSTRLRKQLASGGSIPSGMIPPSVVEYVRKYSLYS